MRIADITDASMEPRKFSNSVGHPNRLLGIEIEVENYSSNYQPNFWRIVGDGSLRNNGRELVLAQPVLGDDLEEALSELPMMLTRVDITHRTSVHMHVDVRDLELDQLLSIVLCYAACESVLFTIAGKDRYHNIYCPGLSACYDQVRRLAEIFNSRDRPHATHFISRYPKYTSMNLRSVYELGSVEFRAFRGTSDPGVIRDWAMMLLNFVQSALAMTPMEILARLEEDHEDLMRYCMGNVSPEALDNFAKYRNNNYMNCRDVWYGSRGTQRERSESEPERPSNPFVGSLSDGGRLLYTGEDITASDIRARTASALSWHTNSTTTNSDR